MYQVNIVCICIDSVYLILNVSSSKHMSCMCIDSVYTLNVIRTHIVCICIKFMFECNNNCIF